MSEHQISLEEAQNNLFSCATYLAEEVRSSDGHAEAMKQIVPRYLERGDVDTAAALADTVDDPFVRDRLLTFVAEKCAAIDDDEYAFQLVEAIEDYGMQRQARERIALQKSAKNDFEEALEIAETLEHPDNAFADIAMHQAQNGDESAALATLEKIEFPYAKTIALQNMALLNLQKQETAKAVEYLEKAAHPADEIEFPEEQIRAYVDIANHFAETGQNGRAIETFDKAKTVAENLESLQRDSFLASISNGFLRAGSIDLADRTLDLVSDKTQMTSCLIGFSQTFNEKGEREDALDALEEAYAILKSQKDLEIRSSQNRFRLWSTISVLFARFEKPERAIEIAQEIPDEDEQTSALSQIAQVLALQEKDDLARQAVSAISEDSQRLFALIGISDAKNKLEKRDEAVEILNEAAHLAETVSQLSPRSSAYNELARRFGEYGETDKSRAISHENLETISQIRDEGNRAVALANLAALYEQSEFDLSDAEKEILRQMTK
jgi:tetratricopeptide (TPR) repeat protein